MVSEVKKELDALTKRLQGDLTSDQVNTEFKLFWKFDAMVKTAEEEEAADRARQSLAAAVKAAKARVEAHVPAPEPVKEGAEKRVESQAEDSVKLKPPTKLQLLIQQKEMTRAKPTTPVFRYPTLQFGVSTSHTLSHEQELKDKDARIEALLSDQEIFKKQVKVLQDTVDFKNDQLDKLMKKHNDVELERDQAKELVEELKAKCEEYKETIEELRTVIQVPRPTTFELQLAAVQKDLEAYKVTTDAKINVLEGKMDGPSELRKGLLDLFESQKSKIMNVFGMSEEVQDSESAQNSRIQELEAALIQKDQQFIQMERKHLETIGQMSDQLDDAYKKIQTNSDLQAQVDNLQKALNMKDRDFFGFPDAQKAFAPMLQMNSGGVNLRFGSAIPKGAPQSEAAKGPEKAAAQKSIPIGVETLKKATEMMREFLSSRTDCEVEDLKRQTGISTLDNMIVQVLMSALMKLKADTSVDHSEEIANIEAQIVQIFSKNVNRKAQA